MPISTLVHPHFVLGPGDRGPAVLLVQKALNKIGFEVPEDSEFRSSTEAAVMVFQEKAELEPNGFVDVATAQAIDAVIHKMVLLGRDRP
jgi:peptidoglycan hydrolase-like protein with peptidoglycan-binding domain